MPPMWSRRRRSPLRRTWLGGSVRVGVRVRARVMVGVRVTLRVRARVRVRVRVRVRHCGVRVGVALIKPDEGKIVARPHLPAVDAAWRGCSIT